MTRDNIIRMAREAGMFVMERRNYSEHFQGDAVHVERFAALVIADYLQRTGQYVTNDASRDAAIQEAVATEREACAKLMAGMRAKSRNHLFRSALTVAESEIRARGNQ